MSGNTGFDEEGGRCLDPGWGPNESWLPHASFFEGSKISGREKRLGK